MDNYTAFCGIAVNLGPEQKPKPKPYNDLSLSSPVSGKTILHILVLLHRRAKVKTSIVGNITFSVTGNSLFFPDVCLSHFTLDKVGDCS